MLPSVAFVRAHSTPVVLFSIHLRYCCRYKSNTYEYKVLLIAAPPDFRPTTQIWSYFYVPIQIQVISDPLYNFKSFLAHYTKTKSLQIPHTNIKTFQTPMKNQVISDPPYNFKSFQTPHTISSHFREPRYKNKVILDPRYNFNTFQTPRTKIKSF